MLILQVIQLQSLWSLSSYDALFHQIIRYDLIEARGTCKSLRCNFLEIIMFEFNSKNRKKKQRLKLDSEEIFLNLHQLARNPDYYTQHSVPDDFDGRFELLIFHLSMVILGVQNRAEDGKLLAQALFDRMRDNIDIGFREEGIADTGIKRRIKPMINLFYERLKHYDKFTSEETDEIQADFTEYLNESFMKNSEHASLEHLAETGMRIRRKAEELDVSALKTIS